MYSNQSPPGFPPGGFGPPPGDPWSPAAAVFRGNDFAVAPFRPAGSGGFAAKFVAIGSVVMLLASTCTVGVVEGLRGPTAAAGGTDDTTAAALGLGLMVFGLAYLGAIFTWIYRSWEFLPPEMRRTASGRAISPGEAVALLLVPLYNLYWIFVTAQGLCDAYNAALVQHGKPPSAPRSLATACAIVQVIPYVNWLVGPILWAVYMFQVDAAKASLRG